jgi:hypothetical protein
MLDSLVGRFLQNNKWSLEELLFHYLPLLNLTLFLVIISDYYSTFGLNCLRLTTSHLIHDKVDHQARSFSYGFLHLRCPFFQLLGENGKYLWKKRDESFLKNLSCQTINLDLLPPLLRLHMLMMIRDGANKRVHPIIISDLCRHKSLDLFYSILERVIIRELRQNLEHLLPELKERILS